MTMKIPLSQGKFALVDEEDFERVNAFKWSLCGEYASRGPNKANPHRYLHRFIAAPPPGFLVGHINGNGLDNRKDNLVVCKNSNDVPKLGRRKSSKSGLIGVSALPYGRWQARLTVNGRQLNLGRFDTPEDAAKAVAVAAANSGQLHRLNFPPPSKD